MRGSSSSSDMTSSAELGNPWNGSTFGFLQEVQSILRRLQMSFEELTTFISRELKEVHAAFDRLQLRYCDLESPERCGTERGKRSSNWKANRYRRIYYNSNQKKTPKNCNWCGRCGHLEEECWQKNGLCTLCGSCDHTLIGCPKYRATPSRQQVLSNCDMYDTHDSKVRLNNEEIHTNTQQVAGWRTRQPSERDTDRDVSQLSSSSLSENIYRASRKAKAQTSLEDSVYFSKAEVPDYVLHDSVIFPSRSKIKNADCYKLCPMEDINLIERSGRAIIQQESQQLASDNSYDDGGIVLTARDETWDVSSIEYPDRLEETPAKGNHSMRVQLFDVPEEGLSLTRNAVTSGRKKGGKILFGSSDSLGPMTWTSWSFGGKKRQVDQPMG